MAGLEANNSFINLNVSRSFNQPVTTTLTSLSSQRCGEVIVVNRSGVDVLFYDNNYTDDSNSFLLADGESFTFRGLTNADLLSAKTTSGSGTIYFRTQYHSNNPTR